MKYPLFVSESVCAGHPDKICDQISDTVLDTALGIDKNSRVALETLVTTNKIVMAGEVTCSQKLNYIEIAKKVVREIGYTNPILNFDENSNIEVLVHQQSSLRLRELLRSCGLRQFYATCSRETSNSQACDNWREPP